MSGRSDRFRKLGAPGKTGNLFEHFGVAVEPEKPAAEGQLPDPVDAVTCPGCGWYTANPEACEQCGAAVPA